VSEVNTALAELPPWTTSTTTTTEVNSFRMLKVSTIKTSIQSVMG
jgi:hypothetical protein